MPGVKPSEIPRAAQFQFVKILAPAQRTAGDLSQQLRPLAFVGEETAAPSIIRYGRAEFGEQSVAAFIQDRLGRSRREDNVTRLIHDRPGLLEDERPMRRAVQKNSHVLQRVAKATSEKFAAQSPLNAHPPARADFVIQLVEALIAGYLMVQIHP